METENKFKDTKTTPHQVDIAVKSGTRSKWKKQFWASTVSFLQTCLMLKSKGNEAYCRKKEKNIQNGMEIKPLEQQHIHVLTFLKTIIYEYISKEKSEKNKESVSRFPWIIQQKIASIFIILIKNQFIKNLLFFIFKYEVHKMKLCWNPKPNHI